MNQSVSSSSVDLLIKERKQSVLAKNLNQLTGLEIAKIMVDKNSDEQIFIFNLLSPQLAANTYQKLSTTMQKMLLDNLQNKTITKMLIAMLPDDRTALLEKLPKEALDEYIQLLPNEERTVSLMLLAYPEGSTGRLMTTDYIYVNVSWTVDEILDYIRKQGHFSNDINEIYVVDDNNILVDDLNIKELFFARRNATIDQIGDKKFASLSVLDSIDRAVQVFKELSRRALPIIDAQGHLLGAVTVDDILKLSSRRNTATIQKIGAVEALDDPYMSTPIFDLIKKRIHWLILLFLGEMFTATAMSFFEEEISRAVVLALFLPLIISSGGNAGSQSSTLIIRAMALGEVKLKDWWIIFKREIISGLVLGCILGTVGFARVSIWSMFSTIYGEHWLLIAVTIFFSLLGIVAWGSLMGSMLPLLLKRCHADPATSSNPLVATLVDVTGIVIYFVVAMWILQGTLL